MSDIIKISFGQYDKLYNASPLLWPNKPGRMVKKASEIMLPGRALDLGCGDGKNLVFLENLGWEVDGIDISQIAVQKLHHRASLDNLDISGAVLNEDVNNVEFASQEYDLIISYGLYHCLNDVEVRSLQQKINSAIKNGGLFAFASFNDDLPLPENHYTDPTYLREKNHILALVDGWEVSDLRFGTIEEEHLPLVPMHEHSLTWGLFKKV